MADILVEGGHPLMGTVTIPGAKNSVVKLIFASMFTNEDIVLENVPKIEAVDTELQILRLMGGVADWTGAGRLMINCSGVKENELPYETGSRLKTTLLAAGPLLHRFGSAKLPKPKYSDGMDSPVNRIVETWKALGIEVVETEKYYELSGRPKGGTEIVFKTSSHTSTDNAILCTVFAEGETIIKNASEESEIEDLIDYLNMMGAKIERLDPKTIKVTGTHIFKSVRFEVQPDKTECAIYATAALLTGGNIVIKPVQRTVISPFINFLNKIGSRFELSESELKVWRHNEKFLPVNITISPTPGLVPDWQSLCTLLLTQAEGKSTVMDTVFTDRFGYTQELNMMGANIDLIKPSDEGTVSIVSDDSYDFEKLGEPLTLARIQGPTKLKARKLSISSYKYGPVLILAALAAEGRSEISGIERIEFYSENLIDRLISLGATIWKAQA